LPAVRLIYQLDIARRFWIFSMTPASITLPHPLGK